MYYTDNPERDFLRHDRRQERERAKLPVCWYCEEPIQDEEFFLVNDIVFCEECMNRNFRKRTEDYIL